MRRNTMKYGIGLAMALLVTACSNEVEEFGKTSVEDNARCAITVSFPVTSFNNGQTRATDEDYGGAWDVPDEMVVADKGVILIFQSDVRNKEDGAEYTLKEWQDISFKKEVHDVFKEEKPDGEVTSGERWTARSSFTPEAGKYYRFYAFAYNSASGNFSVGNAGDAENSHNLGTELSLGNKQLQNTDASLDASKIASFTLQQAETQSPDGYPIELFGGFLDAYSGELYPDNQNPVQSMIVSGSDAVSNNYSFGGELRRLTGRLEISLSEVPDEVKSVSLIMEKYTKQIPIGWEEENNFFMPFGQESMVTVATSDIQEGNATLSGNMFYTEMSYVYVKVVKDDGEVVYPVRVADKWMPLGPDATVGPVVEDNKITVPTNYWLQLNGSYDNLAKGNLKMKISWEEDYTHDEQLTEE